MILQALESDFLLIKNMNGKCENKTELKENLSRIVFEKKILKPYHVAYFVYVAISIL